MVCIATCLVCLAESIVLNVWQQSTILWGAWQNTDLIGFYNHNTFVIFWHNVQCTCAVNSSLFCFVICTQFVEVEKSFNGWICACDGWTLQTLRIWHWVKCDLRLVNLQILTTAEEKTAGWEEARLSVKVSLQSSAAASVHQHQHQYQCISASATASPS